MIQNFEQVLDVKLKLNTRHIVNKRHSYCNGKLVVTTTLLLKECGQPPVKRVSRVTINMNARLQTLCKLLLDDDIDNTCFLEGIRHLIQLG